MTSESKHFDPGSRSHFEIILKVVPHARQLYSGSATWRRFNPVFLIKKFHGGRVRHSGLECVRWQNAREKQVTFQPGQPMIRTGDLALVPRTPRRPSPPRPTGKLQNLCFTTPTCWRKLDISCFWNGTGRCLRSRTNEQQLCCRQALHFNHEPSFSIGTALLRARICDCAERWFR